MIVITDTFNDDLGSIIKGCEEGAHHLSLHITIWINGKQIITIHRINK